MRKAVEQTSVQRLVLQLAIDSSRVFLGNPVIAGLNI
jgi:hypothetical protein